MNGFLRDLIESGHVAVPAFGSDVALPQADAVEADLILEIDRRERLEFPGEAPALSLSATRWAAATFYRACQLLVCRDVPAAKVTGAFTTYPGERSPETHYSLDLVLRYLPDLIGTARRLAAGDTLVDALVGVALKWPLSSVGVPGLKPEDLSEIDTLVGHRGLRQRYADRIIAHDDASRLQHPAVRRSVLASLGRHAMILSPDSAALSGLADSPSPPAPNDF